MGVCQVFEGVVSSRASRPLLVDARSWVVGSQHGAEPRLQASSQLSRVSRLCLCGPACKKKKPGGFLFSMDDAVLGLLQQVKFSLGIGW